MKRVDSLTTNRVVNEDPSESCVTVDEEFENETVHPINNSTDAKRHSSCEKVQSCKQVHSCERKSNIKLSILTAIKKQPKMTKKQRSTS